MWTAILIDPTRQLIEQILLDPTQGDDPLDCMREIIECRYLEDCHVFSNADHLYVDDDGKNKKGSLAFKIIGHGESNQDVVIFGRAIIIGRDHKKNVEISCTTKVMDLHDTILFLTTEETAAIRQSRPNISGRFNLN